MCIIKKTSALHHKETEVTIIKIQDNYITEFLDLKGIQVKKLERKEKGIFLHITTKAKTQNCPCCNNKTNKIHDYRTQTIKDVPYHHQMVYFVLKKRRYVCKHCNKRFYESYDFLARYLRRTTRATKGILYELFDVCTKKEIAKRYQVSTATVSRVLKMVSFEKAKLPKVLCIDEFKGNAETGKYQCILVDGKHHKVIDILKDRTFAYLQSYFSSYTRQERKRVEYFVCDLWSPYAEIARSIFPNAKLIAARYHFVRQVYWAVEGIRKEKQKSMPKEQRKYFKRSKKLLLAPYESLKEEDKQAVDLMLWYHEDLRKAHDLKERFYKIIRNKKNKENNWIVL